MTKTAKTVGPEAVSAFWFEQLEPKAWFEKNESVDREIAERFAATHLALAAHVPPARRESAEAVLALIIVFDQFPRNIYRDTPLAFATDGLGLREAVVAVETGLDRQVDKACRPFFYMPFEHSERMEDQDRSVALFTALGKAEFLDYANRHRDVIAEFGRFPHRNPILGRESTPAELTYLAKPGAGF